MTASNQFTFFTSHNDTQERQQSKQQFLSTEDQYIKLLNLVETELGTKNEVALREWLSAIKVLGQIHSTFYKKLDTESQDLGVVDTMINWGNTLEKPYLDYIKAYDQSQSQHQPLLCASIKSIIKNMSPTSSYYSTEGLLAAPLDQLELYKSIYLTLLDTSDPSKQLPLNNIIQNIDTILQQAPPRMVDPTSTTDLLAFQNFVDCENVIDLFTGSSLDYQLRPRPGNIVLQDDFLLLGDNNDQPATRVHMVLTSDILMICKQMVASTGRFDLLFPPLAVNDILVKPSMLDRELIGEYTLELTVLSKTLALRAESREVRNAWTGMSLTATSKDAITTNIPLKNIACSAPVDGNGINNSSTLSLTLTQNGKSDLGSFYGNHHDISPVESSEDDDDSDEDNDSHATTASTSNSDYQQTNKKSLPSLPPGQPQPPKKNVVVPPPKDIATPVINISLQDDKGTTAQPSSNRPITPRGSSIRAPLPNPTFRPNVNSSTPFPDMKPLPRTSSIRHRQQNAPRPEGDHPQSSMTPMQQQRPSHQQQASSPHQMYHPQQRPPPHQHQQQHRNPTQSMPGARPPPPSHSQHAHGRPMMVTPPQPQYSPRPPNGPHQQMQHRPPPPHHQQQQQYPVQMRPPHSQHQPQPRPPQHHQQHHQQQQQRPSPGSPQHSTLSQPNHHPPQQPASKPVPQPPGAAAAPSPAPTNVTKRSDSAVSTQRPMPPTPPPQQSQFSTPSSSSSEASSSHSHLPLTPGSRDSFGSSLRLSPEDLATPPRSPNPYSAQQNNQNGIRQVLFRSQQCEVFRWNDDSWYAVDGQCILEVRQTFTNRSCIAIRVQTTGELYLNAWVLPQTQIRLASPTDLSLGVVMGSQQETYLVHFGEPSEASELNQILQKMHHAAVVAARQPNDAQRTLRGEPPTEMVMAAMQLDDDDDDDDNDDSNPTTHTAGEMTSTATVGRTMTRSSSLMQSGKEPTLIPQTLEPAMQCKCKLFVQNEHSNWSSFGSVQVIVSLQVPSRRMHIQIENEKKRGLSKIIPTVNNNNNNSSSNISSPSSPPSPSSSSSSSLPGNTENSSSSNNNSNNRTASPTTANTLVSATVYSNNVTRLGSKRISFLLVNERERTSSMVYMVQVKDEESGNALYNYLKIKNAEHGW